jgi:exopolysaccharide production protein ExoZ
VRTKLHNLQVLRGLAAIMVCALHSKQLVEISGEDKIYSGFMGGIGVPLFFIISGFIMVFTTQNLSPNRLSNSKEFILKRLIRIIPLFYFSVIGIIFIYRHIFIQFFTTDLHLLLKTIFFIPLFITDVGPGYGGWFFYVSWSLNYEMFFYVLFAISLLFNKNRYTFIFIVFFILCFCIPFILKGYISFYPTINYRYSWKYLNFFTNPILLLFVLGVIFGLIVEKVRISTVVIKILIAVSAVAFFAYFFKLIPQFPLSDLLFCGFLVFTFLLYDFHTADNSLPKPIVYLGDISYSIYLTHPLVFYYLPLILKKLGYQKVLTSWFIVIVAFCIVLIFSAITYELIEKRFSSFLRRKLLMTKTGYAKKMAIA